MDTLPQSGDRALYEADEHAWIARQIDALRGGQLHLLDRDSLMEYLSDMTIRDRRELESRLAVLLQHMLKFRMQPERRTRSWMLTVLHQQAEIAGWLRSVPSLRAHGSEFVVLAYPLAVRLASAETAIPAAKFPPVSPWTIEQALAFVPPEPPPREHRARRA